MTDIPFPFQEAPKRSVKDIDPPKFAEMHKLDISEEPLSHHRIKALKDWHKIMAELQVMGYQNRRIAHELGVHEMSVSRVQRDPIYRVYIADLRKEAEENSVYDVAAHLQRVTQKTFQTLEDLMMTSESDNVRVTAAKEFADRISPKITKTESESRSIFYFESDTLKTFIDSFRESSNIDPKLLDGKTDEEILDILDESVEGEEDGN